MKTKQKRFISSLVSLILVACVIMFAINFINKDKTQGNAKDSGPVQNVGSNEEDILKAQITELQNQNSELQNENNALEKQNNELQNQVTVLTDLNSNLEDEINNLNNDLILSKSFIYYPLNTAGNITSKTSDIVSYSVALNTDYADVITEIEFSSIYNGLPVTKVEPVPSNFSLLTKVVLPYNITLLADRLFKDCTSLIEVVIPNSVVSIGEYAFHNCTSLTSVNIPESLTNISLGAFFNCTSLTSVNIPDTVISIGTNAFYNCTSLTNVNIPKGVTSISSGTFQNCESLLNIIIPQNVTSIGTNAFNRCGSFTKILIPENVLSISNSAFAYCPSVTEVVILGNVSLGISVFSNSSGISYIYISSGVTVNGGNQFNSSLNATTQWYTDAIDLPEGWGVDKGLFSTGIKNYNTSYEEYIEIIKP